MSPSRTAGLWVAPPLLTLALQTLAAAPEWYGSYTLDVRDYTNFGDQSLHPHADEGVQSYAEFDLGMDYQITPYNQLDASIFGLANRSEYRSGRDEDLILEYANVTWKNGESALPFHAELGDFLGAFSNRTLQLGLKGAMVEIQPPFEDANVFGSLMLIAGSNDDSTYNGTSFGASRFLGASWLVEHSELGALSLNWVHNSNDQQGVALSQDVASIAIEAPWRVGDHDLTAELEFTALDGDASATQRGVSANGWFARFGGRNADGSLNYSLEYEENDAALLPAGGAVSADIERLESRAQWRTAGGTRFNGRLRHYRSALSTATPLTDDLIGLGVQTRPFPDRFPRLTARWDGFVQHRYTLSRATDQETYSNRISLSTPLNEQWHGSVALNHADVIDQNAADASDYGVSLQATRSIRHGDLVGSVTPRFSYLVSDGATSRTDSANLGLSGHLGYRAHSLSASLGVTGTDGTATSSDLQVAGVRYGYRKGPHTVSADLSYNRRSEDPANLDGGGYVIGVTWRYDFDTRSGKVANDTPVPLALADVPEATGVDLILRLAPGAPRATALKLVGSADGAEARRFGTLLTFDRRVFANVDQEQIVVLDDAARLRGSAVVIDLADASASEAGAVYDTVLERLLRALGAPDLNLGEGAFAAGDLVNRIRTGEFQRVSEWRLDGGTLRFGFPQVLDGRLKLVIRHADNLPALPDSRWGLDQLP